MQAPAVPRWPDRWPDRWSDRQIVAAALGAWFMVGVLALASGPPLGHDEAAYAVAARDDAPPWHYRSTGMIAIARLGLALGGSDLALRGLGLVLGAGMIVAAFALGKAAFDARTGAWAAVVLATAHPMAARSAELIGDLPATACLLGGVAVLLGELELARPRWRIVWAAPLFAAAFYIRYGSAPVIAMIAVLALVLYARRLACLPVLATVVVAALLLVPHVVQSIETTGSPLGILRVSASMPRRAYLGEGLVTYVTSNPFRFYGAIVAPVMIAGLATLGLTRRRAPWFVVLLALGQVISLGIQSHAQPRYVFFATALLVVAGVDVLRGDRLDLAARGARVAVVACGLAWLGLAIAIVPYQHYLARHRRPLYAAAAAVRDDAAGRPCAIAANLAPQLIWATGCEVVIAKTAAKLASPWPPAAVVEYVVSVPYAVISPGLLRDVAATARARPHELPISDSTSPEARAWRLDR
ncbi:MAG TPA: glycosyltransferase family 39 protein [Kofleriaceae bacterium]|nr:glycosyltransferase family 39 protein [Kofleriaceae bacterium]